MDCRAFGWNHGGIRNHCRAALARPGLYVLRAPPQADVKTENLSNSLPTWAKDYVDSLGELAYCGWCLSPWVSLPVWAMAAKINRIRFGVKWVAGWIVAAGMAAFLRHSAETAVA